MAEASADAEENLRAPSLILGRVTDLSASWGGKLYFVYFPKWGSVKRLEFIDPEKASVMQLVESADIAVVDLGVAFGAVSIPARLNAYTDRSDHLIEEGHRMVSKHVIDAIRSSEALNALSVNSR